MKFFERLFVLWICCVLIAACSFGLAAGWSSNPARVGNVTTTTYTSTRYELFSNINILSGNSDTIAVIMVCLLLMTVSVAMFGKRGEG